MNWKKISAYFFNWFKSKFPWNKYLYINIHNYSMKRIFRLVKLQKLNYWRGVILTAFWNGLQSPLAKKTL